MIHTITIENGKYEFDLDENGLMVAARRHGETWDAGMEFRFAKCFMSMLSELEEARTLLAAHNAGATDRAISELASLIRDACIDYADRKCPDFRALARDFLTAAAKEASRC